MTRKECLDAAAECVLQDRNNEYGGPEDNFGRIANFWTDYLGVKLEDVDVAMMMALLKIARIRFNKVHKDGYVDLAGYAACGAELVGVAEAREKALHELGEEYRRLKAEEKKPKFNPGDLVQYRVTLPSVSDRIWVDGTYDHILPHGAGHMVRGEFKGDLVAVGKDDVRRRPEAKAESKGIFLDFSESVIDLMKKHGIKEVTNIDGTAGFFAKENGTVVGMRFVTDDGKAGCATAPKAEGCEDLVYDAPQTKEELMERIASCNPAIYGGHAE